MSVTIDGSASVTINSGAILGITSGTAVASTSGTSIDFTSIPSWVKRVTVMLSGVSTSGTSNLLVQVGSGSVTTSGYTTTTGVQSSTSSAQTAFTNGFNVQNISAATVTNGTLIINNLNANIWVGLGNAYSRGDTLNNLNGIITLGGVLDRVRITTVGGTDTFDAGTINILYE